MIVLVIYSGAIAQWIVAHIALRPLFYRRAMPLWQLRMMQHWLQLLLVLGVGAFEFLIRPYLAHEFTDLELAFGPYALVYGLPTGAILALTGLSGALDLWRMYHAPTTTRWNVFRSYTFWSGLAFCVLVPPIAVHPIVS